MKYMENDRSNRFLEENLFFGMEQMMNTLLGDIPDWEAHSPRVNIREEKGIFLLEAELPGYTEKEVNIRVEDNILILEADHTAKEKKEGQIYLLRERKESRYKRSFVLPKEVDPRKIDASMKNGILILKMKKRREAKPLTIDVKAS